MKRMFLFSILVVLTAGFYSYFYHKGPEIDAESYILINANTGENLFGKHEDLPFAAASMSKLMTEYLVLESITEGRLNWDDRVAMSEHAANSMGVKIDVPAGAMITVRDLFTSMVVASANNAAIALAEAVGGSEENFTALMNDHARDFGLSRHTRFVNATGLPALNNEENVMTARDVSKLAVKLIGDYPEVLETTQLTFYQLAYDGSVVYSTNQMLNKNNPSLRFEGVDGLKTGFTDRAGYCFTGTVERNGERYISVVMGTEETEKRFIETRKLFAYGFNEPNIASIKSIVREYVSR
ncbi:MAG: D-alanyl-D-alanine carboxypeptidase family protein [Neobacillus sp.]